MLTTFFVKVCINFNVITISFYQLSRLYNKRIIQFKLVVSLVFTSQLYHQINVHLLPNQLIKSLVYVSKTKHKCNKLQPMILHIHLMLIKLEVVLLHLDHGIKMPTILLVVMLLLATNNTTKTSKCFSFLLKIFYRVKVTHRV